MEGRAAVGSRVSIRWTGTPDAPWYSGRIVDYAPATNEHLVLYDDGEQKMHVLGQEELQWAGKEDEAPEQDSPKAAPKKKSPTPKLTSPPPGEPAPGDEHFIPAKLYPSEKPRDTPYGRGWVASVLKVFSRKGAKIVQFEVEGVDPEEMQLSDFVKNCKRTDSLEAAPRATKKGSKRKAKAKPTAKAKAKPKAKAKTAGKR